MGYTFLDSSLDVVLNHFNRFDTVAIDLETSGLSPLDSRLLLCQVGFPDHQYVIDARKVSLTPLIPFLESNKWTKIFFNGKFDCGFLLHNFNCSVKNIFDCFLAERVLYSDAKGGQSFEDLALKYLGVSLNKAVRKSFYGKSSAEFTEDQIKYSAEDVQYLFPLMEAQVEELSKKDLLHIARLEFDLVPTVSAMEVTGVPIDKNKWRGILGEYAQEQSASRLKLLSIFFSQNPDTFTSQLGLFEQDDNALPEGVKELNLGSHLQIKEAFKRLGINLDKTDERMLQTINHPAAKELLVYRGLDKIRTSYGEKSFIDKIHPFTGRIHANWQQVGTETGRFACKDPNLQQMPEKFRSCVVAQAGFTIIGADFSQMELRILAQESKDPVLMAAFLEGKDVHTATASTMFNIPFDKVTKEQRFTAKCVTGNTLIDTSEGLIPIKFLSDFREADTFTDNINLTVFNSTKNKTKVDSFYYGGIQPCKKVTLVGGRVIEGTPNHKIKILEEGIPTWKRLDDISIGDAVHLVERGFDDNSYQTVKFNFWNSTNIKIGENLPTITFDEAWAEIFGVIFGDGNISGHSIDIAGHLQDMDVLENFRALCRSVGIETTLKETKKDNFKVHVGSRRLRRFLNLFDVKGPHIPSIITNSPRTVVCSYIRGLYDTDGWHSKDTIGFCSQHETFIRELQIVLGRLGIFSSIEKTFNTTYQKFYWKLLISSIADAQLYSTLIGFTSSRKRLNPKAILNQGRLSKPRKRNLVKLIENSVQEVFDLYIPEGNEFIGNGMVNHNTLNFGITYGMGPPKFADMLSAETKKSVSIQQAANLMERYKDTYKTASRWLEQMSMSALRDGYVQTIYGRKRYFNPVSIELPAKQYKAQVGAIKRQGANTPIQGCLSGDSLILTEDYGILPIEQCLGYGGRVWNGYYYSNATVTSSGFKKLTNVTLGGRNIIKCSPEHKFKVVSINGVESWVEAQHLKKNSRVRLTETPPEWHRLKFPDRSFRGKYKINLQDFTGNLFDLGCLLGRIASDGSLVPKSQLQFLVAEHEIEILDYLLSIAKIFGHVGVYRKNREKEDRQPMTSCSIGSSSLSEQLWDIKKTIPKFIFTDSDLLRGYLRGVFDGDGSVSVDGPSLVSGKTENRKIWIQQIQKSLAFLGIRANLAINDYSYSLHIRKADSLLFANLIGFINSKKQKKCLSIISSYPEQPKGFGRCLTVRNVENTEVIIPMYDVVNSDSGMFVTGGVITHNTNADITKMAMIQVYDDLRDYGYRGSIILQVHDEIVILAHKSQAEAIKPLLVDAMVQAGQRLLPNVPVKVDSYVTEAWKK